MCVLQLPATEEAALLSSVLHAHRCVKEQEYIHVCVCVGGGGWKDGGGMLMAGWAPLQACIQLHAWHAQQRTARTQVCVCVGGGGGAVGLP
jgi:hypothetical protein